MQKYFPFDPNPQPPTPLPPPHSCDCQFHVFGDAAKYPVRPGADYVMPTATFAEATKMHRTLGIERGLIVQPTTYGLDHQALLDALAEGGKHYRGCAVSPVLTEASDSYLAKLHDAGVRGARFNFPKRLNLVPSPEAFSRMVDRLKELGWYAKVQPDFDGITDDVMALIENLDITVVIDHMARAKAEDGPNGRLVRKVVDLLKKGNFWVMLSNGHKISKAGYPWDDMIPIARAYIDAAPDRMIWSTDWPHPVSTKQPPNDGKLLELLYRYAPDETERKRILVDNPAALFGFTD